MCGVIFGSHSPRRRGEGRVQPRLSSVSVLHCSLYTARMRYSPFAFDFPWFVQCSERVVRVVTRIPNHSATRSFHLVAAMRGPSRPITVSDRKNTHSTTSTAEWEPPASVAHGHPSEINMKSGLNDPVERYREPARQSEGSVSEKHFDQHARLLVRQQLCHAPLLPFFTLLTCQPRSPLGPVSPHVCERPH